MKRSFAFALSWIGCAVAVSLVLPAVASADDPFQRQFVFRNELPMCASTLATGGDLVFAGEPSGEFNALDARTGELLWQFQCGSGHHSSPSTYTVDGRQYVAVPVGWGGWAEGFLPGMLGAGHGSALMVFALPEA